MKNINKILENYSSWNDESLFYLKELIKNDLKEDVLKIISEFKDDIDWGFTNFNELYDLIKPFDRNVAFDLAISQDFQISKEDISDIIKEREIEESYETSNSFINSLLEESYLDDENKFNSSFSNLDGQSALKKISIISNKKLKEKVFFKFKDEILKRFGSAGMEESRYIKDIVELGILDEKHLNRAIKRISKNAPDAMPIASLHQSGFFQEDFLIELASQKGWDKVFKEKGLPKFIINAFIENNKKDSVLLDGYDHYFDEKQRIEVLQLLNPDDISNIYRKLSMKEKEVVFKILEKQISIEFNSDSLTSLYKDNKELYSKILDICIENNTTDLLDVLDFNFIDGERIYKIYEKFSNSYEYVEKIAKQCLPKLKEVGLDAKFASEALKSVQKRHVKDLSILLKIYLSEKDQETIDNESVKSVDGAKEIFLSRNTNQSLRNKALAKIASSASSMNDVFKNDLLSKDELIKVSQYSNVKNILNDKYNQYILSYLLSKIDQEHRDSLFTEDSIKHWNTQNISMISGELIVKNLFLMLEKEEYRINYSLEYIFQINNQIVLDAISNLAKKNKLFEKRLLQRDSFQATKYYIANNKPNVDSDQEFIFKEILGKRELNHILKFLKNGKFKDSTDNNWVYVKKDLTNFLDKWENDDYRNQFLDYMVEYFDFYKLMGHLFYLQNSPYRNQFVSKIFVKMKNDLVSFISSVDFDKVESFLTEEEIENLFESINKDKNAIGKILENSDWANANKFRETNSIDDIVNSFLDGSMEASDVPLDICKKLAPLALRQLNEKILRLVYSKIYLSDLFKLVEIKSEADLILSMISDERKSYNYRRSINNNNMNVEVFFENFSNKFNYTHEISQYITKCGLNTAINATKASALLLKYGKFFHKEYTLPLINNVKKANIKAEIKRVIDWLLNNGHEALVYHNLIHNLEEFADIIPKKILEKAYTPELLEELYEKDPSKTTINILLSSSKVSSNLLNKVILQLIHEKSLKIFKKEQYLQINFVDESSYYGYNHKIAEFNLDDNKLKFHYGDENFLNEEMYNFIKPFIQLENVHGYLDFSTKIITQQDGSTFDLSNYEVRFDGDEDKINEIFGLLSFKVPIKLKAKLSLSKNGYVDCFVELAEDKKSEKNNKIKILEEKLKLKQEELQTQFENVLGKINDDNPFGIELEFASKIKRSTLAKKLNEKKEKISGDFLVEDTDEYQSLNYNNWQIKYDSSIKGEKFSAEVVSPLLYGENGLKQLNDVLVILKEISEKGKHVTTGVDHNCGIHVHHDMTDLIQANIDVKELAKALYIIQEPLYSLCHKNRSENHFCEKLLFNSDLDVDVRGRGGFNLQTSKKTIEFRMKEGSLDIPEIINWVRLTKSLMEETRVLFKNNLLNNKKEVYNQYDKILSSIIVEKARQINAGSGNDKISVEDTYQSLIITELLGES